MQTQTKGRAFQPGEPHLWGFYVPEAWDAYLNIYDLTGKVTATKFYTNDLVKEINNFDQKAIIEKAKNYRVQ
jgi:hypothetical protein